MTSPHSFDTQPFKTRVWVPAIGSTAVQSLVAGGEVEATVLGMSSHAVWLEVEDRVVVLSTSDATRLPNGIEIAAESSSNSFGAVTHGAGVEIGHGKVMLEGLAVTVTRWWDPRPALTSITIEQLALSITDLPSKVSGVDSRPLHYALATRSVGKVLRASQSLFGMGSGLTPEGDDYLAGALAATRLLAEALGVEQTVLMVANLAVPLARLAEVRTTAFSAALVQAALKGEVAEPAGAFLRALTGRGDIGASHLDVTRVGHSSGPALAAGIVLGAQALIESQSNPLVRP